MVQPLCPRHHVVMSPLHDLPGFAYDGSNKIDIHGHECSVDACPEKYSPTFGYFTLRRNDDHWNVTQSSSLRIVRSSTQVICGDHKHSMFIESFDAANTNLGIYRCPHMTCRETMKVLTGGPPTYWLGSRYFEQS